MNHWHRHYVSLERTLARKEKEKQDERSGPKDNQLLKLDPPSAYNSNLNNTPNLSDPLGPLLVTTWLHSPPPPMTVKQRYIISLYNTNNMYFRRILFLYMSIKLTILKSITDATMSHAEASVLIQYKSPN